MAGSATIRDAASVARSVALCTHHNRLSTVSVAENARRSDAVVCTSKTHMLLLEVLCELLHRNENNTLIFMQTGREQVSASCAAAPTVLLLRL